MLLLIPLLPFVGFLVNASFGRRVGKATAGAVACAAMIVSLVIAGAAGWQLVSLPADGRAMVQSVFTWIASGDFSVGFTLRLDPLSAVMILVVTGVGSLIHVYSTAYMHEESDAEYARYFSYLNLFAAFMLVLVLGANFLVLFVGWEGVGLCSYLLIGFWYQKNSAADAGKKAFIVNRIGDFGFVLGILLAFVRFGTLDFQEIARSVAAIAPESTFGTVSLIALLLFIGATGKSAQIPLYVWLPDAMEGPTPVSALIHAATMVTAGVYMIGRNAVLFGHAPQTLTIVAIVGVATALMAGSIGLVQNDIKRVLAYSTVSQLGYMFLAMGVGAYAAGIFHLYTHAFFKALLFLGSGAVIHALAGEQDLRRMGGLKDDLPVTYWTFVIGALAIAGVPFLSGFFSKDEILARTFTSGHVVLWAIGVATSLLTAVYMFRLVFLAFHGVRRSSETGPTPAPPEEHDRGETPGTLAPGTPAPGTLAPGTLAPGTLAPGTLAPGTRHPPAHLQDATPAMALVLIVLAIGSVLAGYAGLGGRFERFLEPSFAPPLIETRTAPSVEWTLMGISTVVAFAGLGIATFFFLTNTRAADQLAARFAGLARVLANKYYVDEIYDAAIVQPIRIVSEEALWKGIDVRVIDGAVNGVGETVGGTSQMLRQFQTGSVRAYAASLFVGVVLILGYYLWR